MLQRLLCQSSDSQATIRYAFLRQTDRQTGLFLICITTWHCVAAGENGALIDFFKVRNPTLDLRLNVDSLLTKPIVVRHAHTAQSNYILLWSLHFSQRISRYPLFMSAMLDHMIKDSEESLHLKGKRDILTTALPPSPPPPYLLLDKCPLPFQTPSGRWVWLLITWTRCRDCARCTGHWYTAYPMTPNYTRYNISFQGKEK